MGNEGKVVQFKIEDINRIIIGINNLSVKGVEQASIIVDIINLLNSGKIIDEVENKDWRCFSTPE